MRGSSAERLGRVGLLIFLCFPIVARGAEPPLDPANPVSFFTNAASRLLQTEFNLSLTRIQIFPTNQYTPAVHRLLQVAANIYESTTNRFNDAYPHLPTVFRPRFTNDGGVVFVTGFIEETNTLPLSGTLRDVVSPTVANAVQPDDLIFGGPLIIGAKKGLPNFNEFSMETVFQITRKVELRKSAPGGASMINETNQMFIIGISNVFGAEFWNSYTTDFPRAVDVFVTNICSLALTNDYGYTHTSNLVASGAVLGLTNWPAWDPRRTAPPPSGPWSFIVPLRTNHIILPESVYRFAANRFDPLTPLTQFERPSGFDFPRWGLTITNRVLAAILEHDTGRVIDYVQLGRMVCHRDFSLDVAVPPPGNGQIGGFNFLWATNSPEPAQPLRLSDFPGVLQQILVSGGYAWGFPPDSYWQNYGLNEPQGMIRDQVIANFLAFFENNHSFVYVADGGVQFYGTNTSLVVNVPFTPTAKFSARYFWQANDPMVHYLTSDLQDVGTSGVLDRWAPPGIAVNAVANLRRLNTRYQPWSGNPQNPSTDPNDFNLAFKDPLVNWADCWNFPDSEPLSLASLARIHRGTPWQNWTGNLDTNDALHSRPVRDWPLVAAIYSLLNTNDPRQLVSVNEPNPNVWLAVLDSIVALTNSVPDDALVPSCSPLLDPITVTSNSVAALILEAGIRAARAAQLDQRFYGLDTLLTAPELSVASPWLNRSSAIQLQHGINDEAYETVPAQLLARLRPDSLGSIIADNGVLKIQFTGFDGYPYGIDASANLVDWIPAGIAYPTNGNFEFTVWPTAGETKGFYRSVLLP